MPGRPPSCRCGSCEKCKALERTRSWRARNRAYVNEQARRYRQTEAGRQAEADRQRRDRAKINARRKVVTALGNGTLERGPCERAGPACTNRIEAHHDDYDKPHAAVFASGWALTTKLLALAGVVLVAFGALAVLAQRDPGQS